MTGPLKHPLAIGAVVHVKSEHFAEECEAVIRKIEQDSPGHWAYCVDVISGDTPEDAREPNGEIWLCDFEVHPLT